MEDRQRSRHTHSVSISTAIRSNSPSPSSASPSSPTGEGLSRRLSWNRSREDPLITHDGATALVPPPSHHSLAPHSRVNLISDHDEHDVGSGWVSEPQPVVLGGQNHRPYFHRFDSEASIATSAEFDSHSSPTEDIEDIGHTRLTSGRPAYPSNRRDYGAESTAGPSSLAASVVRSPTFRQVTKTLRNASIRVASIMGTPDDNRMQRIRTNDDEEFDRKGHNEEYELKDKRIDDDEDIIPPQRPDPMPPEEGGLRGRTLCYFSARSRVRRAMHRLMRNSWTEPIILALIIVNVVILAMQAASPLNTPRIDDGYFRSWPDYVLFVLFVIFSVEMFARIVTTGLIFDPDTSMRVFFFAPNGLIPSIRRKIAGRNPIHRAPSAVGPRQRAAWRSASGGTASTPSRKATIIPEAPFQAAVERQHDLAAQNRPYLRHSWHRIDMLAISAFWVTFILALTGIEATNRLHLYIFRALSILRIGRLLVITSGTATILHSLKRAGPLLITVTYFVVFAGILFSIIGVQSFRGSFRRDCILADPNNSTNQISLSQQCGGYLDSDNFTQLPYIQLNGKPANAGPKGYICPVGQVCQTTDQNPTSNTVSFDNIFTSMIQVVVIGSINTWTPVMYQAMDSDYYSSCLFFIVGVIVINFWLLNLVVAVVVNVFQSIRADTKKSAFGADDTAIGADPQWATKEKKHKHGTILRLYEKTELFWVALVLASLVAQAVKTASSSQAELDLLRNLELAFTLAFDIEMVIRIAGYFPDWQSFFSRPRNSIDLFLAVATSIIQIPAVESSSVYQWLTIFQLLRWYRFILAVPRMKQLLLKLFGGFAGLLNMIVFLLMINFIAALVAVQLFRGDLSAENQMSFSQTWNSFLAMYQLFSSENWTGVLYDAMAAEFPYVQGWLAAIFLCGWFLFSYFIVLQMFVAVIMENFATAEEQKRKQQVEAFLRKAEPPAGHVSWIDRLNPYRLMAAHHHSVKVHNLPPNLVLPLKQNAGQDVGGYSSAYPDPRSSADAKGAMRRLLGFDKEELKTSVPKRFRPRSGTMTKLLADDDDDDRGLTDLLPPLNAGPSADEHLDALRERRNQQADFISAHPTFDQSLWLFKQKNPIRRFCQACFDPAYGDRIFGRPAHPILKQVVKWLIFAVIVSSIVIAAIATPLYRKDYYSVRGEGRGSWFDIVEVALGLFFVVEALMKIIADGFIFAPNAYLLSIWNVIDFLILITILVNTTTSLIFIGGLSRLTRSLKAFRALRLITTFGRLRDTLHAVLFAGALMIVDASVFMILYLIPFAVWGLNIFSGRMYNCNNSGATGKSDCIGEYMNSPIDNSLNFLTPNVWSNPGLIDSITKWSFDDFRHSLLILFEIVSLEGWIDVMSAAMNIVGMDLQTQTNYEQWNSIFFLIFNLLGAVIILTLFVSIIIENFSIRSGMALLTVEQRNWVDLSKFIKAQTPSQLPRERPTFGFRLWCYERATNKHGYWMWTFTLIYYVHMLLLMCEDFSNNILTDAQLDWIFLFLTLLYAVDLMIRFIGLGPTSFRANGWNIFDLVVITGSFATTIPALQATTRGLPGNEVNVQLQKLFLVSISLKLVQRIDSLNQLFKTSVASLPAIGNLFLLWAILFLFFGLMDLEVFGLTKMGNNSGSRLQNFYTFGNSLIMLSFMSTGEGWNGYMHDYTVEFPRCTDSDNFLYSDCGSAAWAYGLFICWNIISMYIFLNMFTGVVVESFAYVYQMPGGASLNREDIRSFKKLWAEFDTERTGYIRRKDFVRFFSKLSGVFEVRLYPAEFSVPNLLRASVPDPIENAMGRLLVATGAKQAVDIGHVEKLLKQVDYTKVRHRRQLYARLFNEARISEEPGRGISFTSMLMMIAHYTLIDDEKALQLDDLLARRAKTERVVDMVNLDRVRGLLKTIYWRKRFLQSREERRRTLNAQADGIPAIVLEPMPATPPSEDVSDPFEVSYERDHSISPLSSRQASPRQSPEMHPAQLHGDTGWREPPRENSPALSVGSHLNRSTLSRNPSTSSMLSSEDAHNRRESFEAVSYDSLAGDMSQSVWGDMMREAVDKEDT